MKIKKIIVGISIFLGLGIIGNFFPQEQQVQSMNESVKNEPTKKDITEKEFNDKLEYFDFHTENRNKNITSINLEIIESEIELCNGFSKEIQVFKSEYNLTEEQIQKLDNINNKLSNINISYNTNKQKIKK